MSDQDTNPLHSEHRTRVNTHTPRDAARTVTPRPDRAVPAWVGALDPSARATLAEIASTAKTVPTTGVSRPINEIGGNPSV